MMRFLLRSATAAYACNKKTNGLKWQLAAVVIKTQENSSKWNQLKEKFDSFHETSLYYYSRHPWIFAAENTRNSRKSNSVWNRRWKLILIARYVCNKKASGLHMIVCSCRILNIKSRKSNRESRTKIDLFTRYAFAAENNKKL